MFHNPFDNRSLYSLYDVTMRHLQPYSDYCANLAKRYRRISYTLDLPMNIPFISENERNFYAELFQLTASQCRKMTGYLYVYHMFTNIYEKPAFGISEIKLGDNEYSDITEVLVDRKSFCNLIRFKKMK